MSGAKLAASAKQKGVEKLLTQIFGTTKMRGNRRTKAHQGLKPGEISGSKSIRRVDVVSKQLCDDVIGYLAPTLEQHKGCTLLDFHPGTCLFSEQLNKFLKPKTHYLIEPEENYHEPFIKPLLKKSRSKYLLADLPSSTHPALRWEHPVRTRLNKKLFPERTPLPKGDPRAAQFDPSVLVIGNLVRQRLYGKGKVLAKNRHFDLQELVLFAMANDCLAKAGFFEAGLVRMLWWVPDESKEHLVSANIPSNRSALDVGLDMAFGISEVAGVKSMHSLLDTSVSLFRKRLDILDSIVSAQVATRMQERGLIVPRSEEPIPSQIKPGKQVNVLSPLANLTHDAATLENHITVLAARLEEIFNWAGSWRVQTEKNGDLVQASLDSLQYPQSDAIEVTRRGRSISADKSGRARRVVLLDLGLRLLNAEASCNEVAEKSSLDRETLDGLRERILALGKRYNELAECGGSKIVTVVNEFLEDQLAFFSSSPLISWDRRSYEPFQIAPEDLFPTNDVALLDFMPKAVDLSVPDLADAREGAKLCAQLLKSLFSMKSQSLPVVLERIAVNASKDLIPQVPAITDARKGGRLNPEDLKVRMLTTEMIEGLVKAWFEWPFRPQSWELSLVNGEAEGDEAAQSESEESAKSKETEEESSA